LTELPPWCDPACAASAPPPTGPGTAATPRNGLDRPLHPLTGEELLRFWNDYMALYQRYADETREPADEARRVLVRFVAFPDVDEEREGRRPADPSTRPDDGEN
jgi:hypothetical protein